MANAPYFLAAPGQPYDPSTVPQLTLEAAENFAAFDRAQAKKVVDRQAWWAQQESIRVEEEKRRQQEAERVRADAMRAELTRRLPPPAPLLRAPQRDITTSGPTIPFGVGGPTSAVRLSDSTPFRGDFLTDNLGQADFDNSQQFDNPTPFQRSQIAQMRQRQFDVENPVAPVYDPQYATAEAGPRTIKDSLNFGALTHDEQFKTALSTATQRFGEKGLEALRSLSVIQDNALRDASGIYNPATQQLVARGQGTGHSPVDVVITHEVAHAYESIFLNYDQRAAFQKKVYELAKGGDQAAQSAVFAYRDDPQHLFTYFVEMLYATGSPIPTELKSYYDGMFKAPPFNQAQAAAAEFARQKFGINPLEILPRAQRVANAGEQYNATQAARSDPSRLSGEEAGLFARNDAAGLALYQRANAPDATQQDMELYQQHLAQNRDPATFGERATTKAYDAARTEIPYADRVADVAGNLGERAVKGVFQAGPMGTFEKALPDQYRPSTIAGNIGGWAAEALVPQEVWQAALELVPGIGTVPGVVSAVRKGTPEAILAGRKAAAKLGQSEAFERVLKEAASERGALTLGPGDEAAAGAGEAASSSLPADVLPLPSQSLVPENVVTALKNRNKAVAKNPDDLQAAWEMLPPVNRKMITDLADAVLSPTERKAITKAGRARQTARAREAITETKGTTLERARAGRGAMSGRIIPQIKPIGGAYSSDELADLFKQIDDAFDARTLLPQEHANATDAMELLLYGKRPLSPEKPLSLMPAENKLLGRIYGPEFEAVLPKSMAQLSAFQKAIDFANLPRAIIAGIDISAPGRQGIVLAARNPAEWGRAWGPMVKSMLSEKNYTRELERMQADDYFEDAVLHGIDFTDIGGGAAAEEAFQTRLIQGNVFLRNTVGRGERGYTAYLDKLRLSVYKKGAKRLERTASKHGWEAERLDLAKKDWGGFVNHASGRGDLGGLNQYVPAMNALFFSPRFVISRPQTIYDLVKSDPAVRTMVGENLGAFVGSGVLLMTAAAAAGAQVELDPRSSDFGKIRIGDQRIEFWGGFQPLARYIAQVATGERKTLTSGEAVGVNRWKTVGRFIRSKLSPAGALGWDLTVEGGRNYEGENFLKPDAIPSEAMNRLMPLVLQDAIEGYQSQGALAGLRAAGVSVVGGGVGTFEASEREQRAAAQNKAAAPLNAAGYDKIVPDTWRDNLPALESIEGLPKPISEYDNIEDAKADYLAPVPGGVIPTRSQLDKRAAKWEALPAVKAYKDQIKRREVLVLKRLPIADRQAAYEAGVVKLDADQRKELGIE